jgi:hypothetical protein
MKALTVAATLSLLLFSQAAHAQENPVKRQPPEASTTKPYTAEESATLSRVARDKAEALELARDRKMRAISKGICNGC